MKIVGCVVDAPTSLVVRCERILPLLRETGILLQQQAQGLRLFRRDAEPLQEGAVVVEDALPQAGVLPDFQVLLQRRADVVLAHDVPIRQHQRRVVRQGARQRMMPTKEQLSAIHPLVTILMPVRNEEKYIARSLGAVLAQDYPPSQMEVIVADGMSTDGTRRIVADLQTGHPNLFLIDNPGKIVPTGLNAALLQARGEIIIRVDGHCETATDYVRRCVEHIQQDGVDGIGGSVETIGEDGLSQAIAAAMSSPFGVGDSAFRTQKGKTMLVDSVPFPAYTRAIMQRAGLYDEELVRNQDDEYNYRLRKMGAKILLAADVRSKYCSRTSLRSLWKQFFQYGYWKVRVLQKHPRQMRLRQFVPFLFVFSLIASSALALFTPIGRFMLIFIAGLYLCASLIASAWASACQHWRFFPLLPILFAIIHLSYGLGFAAGLIKFMNRWGDKSGKTPAWSDTNLFGRSNT